MGHQRMRNLQLLWLIFFRPLIPLAPVNRRGFIMSANPKCYD